MSGILSCHLIFGSFLNSLSGNGEISMHEVGILPMSHIQEGWQYNSLVDFQLGVKLDSSL